MKQDIFVKKLREKLNLSQNELAYVIGKKSSRTIRKWEAGEAEVPLSDMALMAMLVHGTKLIPITTRTPEFYKDYILGIMEWALEYKKGPN